MTYKKKSVSTPDADPSPAPTAGGESPTKHSLTFPWMSGPWPWTKQVQTRRPLPIFLLMYPSTLPPLWLVIHLQTHQLTQRNSSKILSTKSLRPFPSSPIICLMNPNQWPSNWRSSSSISRMILTTIKTPCTTLFNSFYE